jgi:hypothetical protein
MYFADICGCHIALGHRSPIMTARYSEFADSERR